MDHSVRLRQSIIKGNLFICKKILSGYSDLVDNIDPSNGWSNIHYAAYHGHYLIVIELCKLIHRRDKRFSKHFNPTADEDEDEDLPVAHREVAKTFKGESCVHLAVLNNHEQTLHLLLQNFPELINYPNDDFMTPLHLAAMSGYHNILQLLLDLGAKAEARDLLQNTPLHYAAEFGHFSCVLLLYPLGTLDCRNSCNCTPFDLIPTFELLSKVEHFVSIKTSLKLDTPITTAFPETSPSNVYKSAPPALPEIQSTAMRRLSNASYKSPSNPSRKSSFSSELNPITPFMTQFTNSSQTELERSASMTKPILPLRRKQSSRTLNDERGDENEPPKSKLQNLIHFVRKPSSSGSPAPEGNEELASPVLMDYKDFRKRKDSIISSLKIQNPNLMREPHEEEEKRAPSVLSIPISNLKSRKNFE